MKITRIQNGAETMFKFSQIIACANSLVRGQCGQIKSGNNYHVCKELFPAMKTIKQQYQNNVQTTISFQREPEIDICHKVEQIIIHTQLINNKNKMKLQGELLQT